MGERSSVRQELAELRHFLFASTRAILLHSTPKKKKKYQNSWRGEKEAGEKGTEPADRLETHRQRGGNTNDTRQRSKAEIIIVCSLLQLLSLSMLVHLPSPPLSLLRRFSTISAWSGGLVATWTLCVRVARAARPPSHVNG